MSNLEYRKPSRCSDYSYSNNGLYFLTICSKNKEKLFCSIFSKEHRIPSVGVGFPDDPKQQTHITGDFPDSQQTETVGLDSVRVKLSPIGIIVKHTIEFLNKSNPEISIDKYVIMPNHLHLLVEVRQERGACRNPPPTENGDGCTANDFIPKFVSSLKRFTNRSSNLQLWQRGYMDHIIRNYSDYLEHWQYIENNPIKWKLDKYYC